MRVRRALVVMVVAVLAVPVAAIGADTVVHESAAHASSPSASLAIAPDSTVAATTPTPTPTPIEAAAPAAPEKVVTIGDSIMAGYRLDASQAWPALLAASDGIDVTNLACSGAGFIAVGGCGADYEGLIAQAVAADPDVVIIQSSDNDLGESADALQAATTRTVDDLQAALPDADIIAFSTLWDQPGWTPAEVADSSASLQSAVEGVQGTYIDLGQPIAGDPAFLQADSEHPTVAGQQALAQAIENALAAADVVLTP
jgi:acyl-CoA thioesterase I